MIDWVTFVAIVTLLTAAMVILSFRTQQTLRPVTRSVDSSRGGTHDLRPKSADRAVESSGLDERSTRNTTRSEPDDGDVERPIGSSRHGDFGDGDQDSIETIPVDEPNGEPTDADSDRPVDALDESTAESIPRGDGPPPETVEPALEGREPASGAGGGQVVAYVGNTPVTRRSLLLNVAATQTLFLAVTVGVIVWAGVPGASLGLVGGVDTVLIGLGAGLGLYGASEVGGRVARHFGVDHDEWLRESLAPTSARGWAGMLGVVLPIVALFEELLFRGVLIGAFAAGFAVSPWVLAIGSSIVFSLGHGIQGRAGIVVTGVLGFVLAAVFVATGSLLTVVVAHYVLNACEFVVHEGLGGDSLG